jgi:hypothetical protein
MIPEKLYISFANNFPGQYLAIQRTPPWCLCPFVLSGEIKIEYNQLFNWIAVFFGIGIMEFIICYPY